MGVQGSEKKYVYITGCDSGFGEILTKKLEKLGFGVFAGVYLESSIKKLKNECSSRVFPIQVDVTKEDSCENAATVMKSVLAEKGAILHGIVNNAGILVQPGPVEWTRTEDYRRMFEVNVMGTVMTTKACLPLIRASQGRIVNVASIAGRVGLPTEPAYCPSKYGVEAYSDVLRRDMIPWGVTVHIIEPGIFNKTGLYNNFETGLDKLWSELDPAIKEDYGVGFYQKLRAGLVESLTGFGNTNSNLVPEAMVDALVSSSPKYRYRVGKDSKYGVTVIEKLHESTQDAIFTRKSAPNVPASAPANGKQLATARYNKGWKQFLLKILILAFFIYKIRSKN